MRKLLVVLWIIAGLIILVVAAGFLLPREHRVSSRIVANAPPDSVWQVVRNLEGLPEFWDDMRSVRRETSPSGHEVWVQTMSDNFEMRVMISEDAPPDRLVTDIVAGKRAPFGGRWIYELEPEGGATVVTVTEDGWIANPVFRLFSLATGLHASLDSYLTALGKRFGDSVTPVHLQ